MIFMTAANADHGEIRRVMIVIVYKRDIYCARLWFGSHLAEKGRAGRFMGGSRGGGGAGGPGVRTP